MFCPCQSSDPYLQHSLFGGLEAAHFLLTQSRGLMGILGPIVEPFMLAMLNSWQDLTFGCSITLQFISNDHPWDILEPFEQLTEKSLGSFFVAAALHQDIQYVALLIHGSPQIVFLSLDRQNHLVEMPFITARGTTTAQFVGVGLPKFEAPLPHRFIGHDDPALGHELFDITKTQRKTEIQPHTVANNFGWEAEPFVIRSSGVCFHAISMPEILLFSKLTIPFISMSKRLVSFPITLQGNYIEATYV